MIHWPLCMRCSFVAVVQRCIIPYTALCHGWRLRALASGAIVSAVLQCQVTYEQPVSGISPSLAYQIPDNRDKPYVVHSVFRTMRLQCSVNVHLVSSRLVSSNRGRHLYWAWRPSRWALAHISSSILFCDFLSWLTFCKCYKSLTKSFSVHRLVRWL